MQIKTGSRFTEILFILDMAEITKRQVNRIYLRAVECCLFVHVVYTGTKQDDCMQKNPISGFLKSIRSAKNSVKRFRKNNLTENCDQSLCEGF